MRHINIPVFIPHLGCPNQCIFCNQKYISGVTDFDEALVKKDYLLASELCDKASILLAERNKKTKALK